MRSSDNKQESSAPSHKTPGAMDWIFVFSGPIANGMKIIIKRKKLKLKPNPVPDLIDNKTSRLRIEIIFKNFQRKDHFRNYLEL